MPLRQVDWFALQDFRRCKKRYRLRYRDGYIDTPDTAELFDKMIGAAMACWRREAKDPARALQAASLELETQLRDAPWGSGSVQIGRAHV
jgi:hypothetical protein